ncbi:hypothetical protein CEXT_65421 [Caerostris extrusa]|uniref:Uncharacterized protein n=1 Tax=Caerostris extrusa TaxID=172846 RepID=A0AAV4V3H9_CAEEX|nr:hypothetical protein CEXT_65421 [Caerostris extrusa]
MFAWKKIWRKREQQSLYQFLNGVSPLGIDRCDTGLSVRRCFVEQTGLFLFPTDLPLKWRELIPSLIYSQKPIRFGIFGLRQLVTECRFGITGTDSD